MTSATKRRKKLEKVEHWLKGARGLLERKAVEKDGYGEFSLLVAVEQLVEYLKMVEEDK